MAGSSKIFDPELVISHKFPETTFTYSERDVALYALGIGACVGDALDEKELKYVYHENGQPFIQVLPTFAVLFTYGAVNIQELTGLQFDPRLLLHGQQYIEIYKPLPTSGCIQNKVAVAGLHDKGKATVVEIDTVSYEKESGEPLCMNRTTIYLRGAGGFSNPSAPYSCSKYPANQISPLKIPKSQPVAVYEECTQESQALLYRLSGDYNPLHSDPKIAEIAGFSRPILHGLCTLGFAVRAITKCICNGETTKVKSIMGRFLLHVYPGETLITEMWLDGTRVLYQTKVKERKKTVLSGYVVLHHLTSAL
ncbi:enoyl-CoA hydratase 2, peroxisomal-like [Telopea speciosissima]|uniref:enoyl-CoA hydratase 2, peroxisomal-like n=1 Tax=Telopea speciosissima TaxID=54955 RepID=UPI001CC80D95|nr:enoyl-CoA hydratase 2, peroxisomal-like [Telopea speciosissima]